MLLAIDTATSMSGLALFDGAVRAEAVWDAGRDHGAQLLPQLTLLCDHLRCRPADLTAIAVTLGPGSWSGLRVGLATAKGLALALDLPLLGVPTLAALRHPWREHGATLALVRLGRDRYGVADDDDPPRNVNLADLGLGRSGALWVLGDCDDAVRAVLAARPGLQPRYPGALGQVRRPAATAELAWVRHQRGEADDRATLEPIYLGDAVR
jgi:tRNA threonylcarbamoyladenosine biosynthesis protein TsaB